MTAKISNHGHPHMMGLGDMNGDSTRLPSICAAHDGDLIRFLVTEMVACLTSFQTKHQYSNSQHRTHSQFIHNASSPPCHTTPIYPR